MRRQWGSRYGDDGSNFLRWVLLVSRPPLGVPGAINAAVPAATSLWSTINPAHAIQRASAILTFGEEVPSLVVNRMVDALRSSAHLYGMIKEDPINAMFFQLGQGLMPQTTPTTFEGVSFQQMHGPNIVQSLNVQKESIRFDTFGYTRWAAFREQVAQFIKQSMPIIEQTVSMKSVALEYVDFFYAKNEGNADVVPIIDRKSEMLVRQAFQRRSPFHSHSGWFEKEGVASRRLVNVDITVNDALGPIGLRRAITIRTHEAEQVKEGGFDRALELVQPESILAVMDEMHVSLKKRIASVLTSDARAMISLDS